MNIAPHFCILCFTMAVANSQIPGKTGGSSEESQENDYFNDEEFNITMTTSDQLIKCSGEADICPSGDLEKLKLASGKFPGQGKLTVDYKRRPYTCRCDADCIKYDDCCVGLFVNGTGKPILEKEHPWKCNLLEYHGNSGVWAIMMSQCPEDSKDLETNDLCKGFQNATSKIPASQKYLFDLPIYSNVTKILYKNIFCARCHGVRSDHILRHTLRLTCNKEFNPEERSQFQKNSEYIPGKRIWYENNITCQLSVQEFWNENIETNIPDIRYCGPRAVQTCPGDKHSTEKTRALCYSYTQYVTLSTGRIFKNPHCFLCHTGHSAEVKPKYLTCKFDGISLKGFAPGRDKPLAGAGLNFLFDFNVFNENEWVGYDMLCDESEVWDYIRHSCHPMICGKNHVLKDDVCQPTSGGSSDSGQGHRDDHEPKKDLSLEPECYRILLHKSEYTFVEGQNDTLVVNLSTGGWIYLTPSEYEIWNETTVSICAKYLHRIFDSRFSPIFNYLSIALVGLSVGFLGLHIFLYFLLPKLRNLPSDNLFCLTLSLFLSQFILLIFITATDNRVVCVVAAILIHYFFLSAFFWMSAMSFDIWRTFSGHSLILHRRRGRHGSFVKYSCFGWGGPFTIVTLAVLTDFGGFEFLEGIQPGYGQTGLCWISQRMSLFVFFALPVALVILSNLVLFSLTARSILIQNKESNRVLSGTKDSAMSTGKNSDEVLLKLYIKLALIMGLTWILGFISAFLLWDVVWYAFVVLNGLQGTFIFFAFDFKRKTVGLIQERLGLKSRNESSTIGSGGGSGKADLTRRGTSTSTTSLSTHAVAVFTMSLPYVGQKNIPSVQA